MSDIGFKVMAKNHDIDEQTIEAIRLSSEYPFLNCFVNKNPRHFGYVHNTIASLAPGEVKTVIRVDHNFGYLSPTLFQWNYPAANLLGSTYGTGDLDVVDGSFNLMNWVAENNLNVFTINARANEFNSAPMTNLNVYFKYYIFGNDFTDAVS